MTGEQVLTLSAVVGVLMTPLIAIFNRCGTLIRRQAIISVKVDILWSVYKRTQKADAVDSGAAFMNSPLRLTDLGREWMSPIAAQLKAFYCSEGHLMKEDDLYSEVEKRFAKELTALDLQQNGLRGAVAVAVAVAKEGYVPPAKPGTEPVLHN